MLFCVCEITHCLVLFDDRKSGLDRGFVYVVSRSNQRRFLQSEFLHGTLVNIVIFSVVSFVSYDADLRQSLENDYICKLIG